MKPGRHSELVLSLVPTARGVAYTLFEAPLTPIDWGLKRIRGGDKNAHSFEIIKRLCSALQPDTLVIEEMVYSNSRRSERVRRLHTWIARHAESEKLTLVCYSRLTIEKTFREAGAATRFEIAHAIAAYIPAFSFRMPRARKLWHAEDHRLFLFDAASLALTHFAFMPTEAEPP
jgi:hypothetical protein